MGKSRLEKSGRYMALYEGRDGKLKSLGTFELKSDADAAWRKQELDTKLGIGIDPAKGKVTVAEFFERHYLPTCVGTGKGQITVGTRQDYELYFEATIKSFFGDTQLRYLTANPELVEQWVARLRRQGGRQDLSIAKHFTCLSAILTKAHDNRFIAYNPCHNRKLFDTSYLKRKKSVVARGAYDPLVQHISDCCGDEAFLITQIGYQTGARFGEYTDLNAGDVCKTAGGAHYLNIHHAVKEVSRGRGDNGGRYVRNPKPKGGQDRKVPINDDLYDMLIEHIKRLGLGADDRLFAQSRLKAERDVLLGRMKEEPTLYVVPEEQPCAKCGAAPGDPCVRVLENLSRKRKNDVGAKVRDSLGEPLKIRHKGRLPAHGTPMRYNQGCRCEHCRAQQAAYQRNRRARNGRAPQGKSGLPRGRNISDHVSHNWFMKYVWNPSREATGIDATPHKLRHAYISGLLAAGRPSVEVRDLAGHANVSTTELYAHPESDVNTAALADTPRTTRRRRLSAVEAG